MTGPVLIVAICVGLLVAKHMKNKLSANRPCWCGSGKKYNLCHRNRERQTPIHPKQLDNQYRRPFERKFCLHPAASKANCGDKIVAAHTIQRAGAISKIIDATNHVYTFYPPERDSKHQLKLHSRGWREASTFMGFCNTHDAGLFADLETLPFIGDERQCFLVGYRALCHEVYQKIAVNAANPILREHLDKGRPKEEQEEIQDLLSMFALGTQKGDEEINAIKRIYDVPVQTNDFSNLNSAVISFDGDVSVASTGVVGPDFDTQGNQLQDIGDMTKDVEGLMFGVVSTATGGAVVFSWPSDFKSCNRFIESLVGESPEEIPTLLIEFMFGYVENTYFSKAWWDSLDKSKQDRITTLANTSIPYGTFLNYSRLKFVNWKITGITTNIK